jgi:hypothetical protein
VKARNLSKVVQNQYAIHSPKHYTHSQWSLHSSGSIVVGCPPNQEQGQHQQNEVFSQMMIKIGHSKSSSMGCVTKSIVHCTMPHAPILVSSPVKEKKMIHLLNTNWVLLSPGGPFPREDSHQVINHKAKTESPGLFSSNLLDSSELPSPSPFHKSRMTK